MKRHSKRHMCYLLIIGITLTACGGGSGGSDIPIPTPASTPQTRSALAPKPEQAPIPTSLFTEMTPFEACGETSHLSRDKVTDDASAGECLRSLVPGMQRFWQERSRAASQTSRLKYISFRVEPTDDLPDYWDLSSWNKNSEDEIQLGVRHFSFLPAQALGEAVDDGSDGDPSLIAGFLQSASNNDVVDLNPAYNPSYIHRRLFDVITPELLTQIGAVIVTHNNSHHIKNVVSDATSTGLMLIVAAPLDQLRLLSQNGPEWVIVPEYADFPEHAPQHAGDCYAAPEYCLVSSWLPLYLPPFNTPHPSRGIHSTIVAAALANVRSLWPEMTSVQTVNLARYCARPINDDGTLAPYGTILSADEASEHWGQGVFSVECLFDANGALFNPITAPSPSITQNTQTSAVRSAQQSGRQLQGGLSLTGTKSHLTLTDIFSRTFSFSRHVDRPELSFAPENISGLYGTQDGVFGLIWKNIGAAMKIEENEFFGSYGTGDFEFGDTMIIMLQLGHEFQMSQQLHFSLQGQSAWGQMQSARGSAISDAEGHTHQLQAGISYRQDRLKASIAARYNFGVRGEIELAEFGALKLAPRSETIAQAHISLSF